MSSAHRPKSGRLTAARSSVNSARLCKNSGNSLGYRPSAEYAQRAMSKQIKTHTTLPELTLALVQ